MTNPVLEDDVVEWLEDFGCDREPFTDSHKDCQCRKASKALSLIDRLQKELKEARDSEAQMRDACKYYADSDRSEMDAIRAKTIEECAKVAENRVSSMQTASDAMAMNIAKAIRSLV